MVRGTISGRVCLPKNAVRIARDTFTRLFYTLLLARSNHHEFIECLNNLNCKTIRNSMKDT